MLQCKSHNKSDYDIYDQNRPAAIEELNGFYFKQVRKKYVPDNVARMVLHRLLLIMTPLKCLRITNSMLSLLLHHI